ncbi:MAG: prepilin-type N-terminal cleavage/methylation domain-containing protein [Candidatus Eremiobacteraeota bacterium]|nr:prepilin-type N-terminal cleavage/methylation domain-containing protein [Candidatus Eremiobacteraeota bacterium]
MSQRGFSLLETIVVVAIVGVVAIATAARGPQPPRLRSASLELQAAFAETRALAAANAVANATGATLVVEPLADGRDTRVTVYRGRPIAGAPPLVREEGFASETLPAVVTVADEVPGPFGIFVSSSGFASVALDYAPDAAPARTFATDPGCPDAGLTISLTAGALHDARHFSCRDARYDADATPPPVRP